MSRFVFRAPAALTLLALATAAVALLFACRSTTDAAPVPAPIHRDLVYGTAAGVALSADVHIPETSAPRPAVIVIHGGSWARGSKERMSDVAARLAGHGFVVMNVNYRLAPQHKFPAALEDVRAARGWLDRNARRFGVDRNRVAVYGYSAGAHLALLLALAPSKQGTPGIRAAVAGAAPSDLTRLPDVPAIRRLIGASRKKRPDLYRAASPLYHVSADDPPVLLFHGRADWVVPISQSRHLQRALAASGVPVVLRELRRGHGTTFLAQESLSGPIASFLQKAMSDKRP